MANTKQSKKGILTYFKSEPIDAEAPAPADDNSAEIESDAENPNDTEDENSPAESEEILEELVEEISDEGVSETINSDDNSDVPRSDGPEISNDRPSQPMQIFISGRLLLGITDAVIPTAIIKGGRLIGYKTNKKRSDLMLTDAEVDLLEPLADNVSKEIFAQLTPIQQFLIALGGIYGSKL